MTISEEKLNIGILIKGLQENFVNGKNEYTIHDYWWEISDSEKLNEIVDKGYLTLENKTISFTVKGQKVISELYKVKTNIAIENIYTHLELEAARILAAFY